MKTTQQLNEDREFQQQMFKDQRKRLEESGVALSFSDLDAVAIELTRQYVAGWNAALDKVANERRGIYI